MVSQLRGSPALAQLLLDYLADAVKKNTFVEIDGGFPYKRAFADGMARQALTMKTFLEGILDGGNPR